jgi:hypothetical protein
LLEIVGNIEQRHEFIWCKDRHNSALWILIAGTGWNVDFFLNADDVNAAQHTCQPEQVDIYADFLSTLLREISVISVLSYYSLYSEYKKGPQKLEAEIRSL